MNADEAIRQAIDTIGKGQKDDYVISPTRHAEELIAPVERGTGAVASRVRERIEPLANYFKKAA